MSIFRQGDKDRTKKTKGKGSKGRQLEASDRHRMCTELQKYSHPVTSSSDHLYNTITGQVAVADINKHQADALGTTVQHDFIASHPGRIRNTISSKGTTMKSKKHKQRWVNDILVFDVDAFFSLDSLSLVRSVIFQSPTPASLINDGCLRKSDKSILTQKLGSIISSPFDRDILIIHGNQFLDHVVWPVSGTIARIAATIMVRLGMLPHKLFLIFYRYDGVSAKVLECMRRAGDDSTPMYVSIHR